MSILQKLKDFLSRNKVMVGFVIIFIVGLNLIFNFFGNKQEQISYSKFLSYVEDKKVESIFLDSDGKKASVKLKENKNYIVVIPSVDIVTELLTTNEKKGNHIDFQMEEPKDNFISIITLIIQIAFYIALFAFIRFKFMPTNNKKTKQLENVSKVKVKFDDIAGIEPQKEELLEVVDFLKNPKKYREIGAKIPKGVLLTGEPGTGKTLLAKAVAGEAKVPFFNMNGSEFEEVYVGVGASRVRKLFENARKNAPSVIFIDEIDTIGGKRDSRYNYSEQTLNQILVEMDGFEKDDVIVIAATNREQALDSALLRPGRFDRRIYIPKPDLLGREKILQIHSKKLTLANDVNLKQIASKTAGYAGAELANVINEAAIIAVRNSHDSVQQSDIEEALRKQMIGIADKSKVISDNVKKLVAYHEAGHAIVDTMLNGSSKVVEISIISRGKAGGYTMYEDSDDNMQYLSKKECIIKISSLLAGRAAEKLILKDVSSGASNDLEVATTLAKLMVTKYGMSDVLGPIALTDEEIISLNNEYNNPISNEIRIIISNCNVKAEKVLTENIALLHKVANYLMKNETISGEEFSKLIYSQE